MDTCLFVTKEFSSTPMSGGELRTLASVQVLAKHYEVTVVSPDGVHTAAPGQALTRVRTAGEPGPWWRGMRRYQSLSGARIGDTRLLDLLDDVTGHFSVGVLEHTCLVGLLPDVQRRARQVLVSTQNVESDLMAQRAVAATSKVEKATMTAETQLLRRLERKALSHATVAVVSQADADAMAGHGNTVVCRNGIFPTPDEALDAAKAPNSMVFSGSLDWGPNVDGILWFLAESWPSVRAQVPDATVTVAGRNPNDDVKAACRAPGVELIANPVEMAPLLHRSQLGIVPLHSGGGSRIKILEYLDAGLEIVSTVVGASGLEDVPAEMMDRLDPDPEQFAKQIAARLTSPEGVGAQARQWVQEHYSWDVTLRPLTETLGVTK